jgi:hypothetical protein
MGPVPEQSIIHGMQSAPLIQSLMGAITVVDYQFHISGLEHCSSLPNHQHFDSPHTDNKEVSIQSFASQKVSWTTGKLLMEAPAAVVSTPSLNVEEHEACPATEIAFLIDESGSIDAGQFQNFIAQVTALAQTLLHSSSTGGMSIVSTSLVFFSTTPVVVQDMTNSEASMVAAINSHQQSEGGTAIGDGIIAALGTFTTTGDTAHTVVLLTDGENTEGTDPQIAIARAAQLGVTIFAGGIGSGADVTEFENSFIAADFSHAALEALVGKLATRACEKACSDLTSCSTCTQSPSLCTWCPAIQVCSPQASQASCLMPFDQSKKCPDQFDLSVSKEDIVLQAKHANGRSPFSGPTVTVTVHAHYPENQQPPQGGFQVPCDWEARFVNNDMPGRLHMSGSKQLSFNTGDASSTIDATMSTGPSSTAFSFTVYCNPDNQPSEESNANNRATRSFGTGNLKPLVVPDGTQPQCNNGLSFDAPFFAYELSSDSDSFTELSGTKVTLNYVPLIAQPSTASSSTAVFRPPTDQPPQLGPGTTVYQASANGKAESISELHAKSTLMASLFCSVCALPLLTKCIATPEPGNGHVFYSIEQTNDLSVKQSLGVADIPYVGDLLGSSQFSGSVKLSDVTLVWSSEQATADAGAKLEMTLNLGLTSISAAGSVAGNPATGELNVGLSATVDWHVPMKKVKRLTTFITSKLPAKIAKAARKWFPEISLQGSLTLSGHGSLVGPNSPYYSTSKQVGAIGLSSIAITLGAKGELVLSFGSSGAVVVTGARVRRTKGKTCSADSGCGWLHFCHDGECTLGSLEGTGAVGLDAALSKPSGDSRWQISTNAEIEFQLCVQAWFFSDCLPWSGSLPRGGPWFLSDDQTGSRFLTDQQPLAHQGSPNSHVLYNRTVPSRTELGQLSPGTQLAAVALQHHNTAGGAVLEVIITNAISPTTEAILSQETPPITHVQAHLLHLRYLDGSAIWKPAVSPGSVDASTPVHSTVQIAPALDSGGESSVVVWLEAPVEAALNSASSFALASATLDVNGSTSSASAILSGVGMGSNAEHAILQTAVACSATEDIIIALQLIGTGDSQLSVPLSRLVFTSRARGSSFWLPLHVLETPQFSNLRRFASAASHLDGLVAVLALDRPDSPLHATLQLLVFSDGEWRAPHMIAMLGIDSPTADNFDIASFGEGKFVVAFASNRSFDYVIVTISDSSIVISTAAPAFPSSNNHSSVPLLKLHQMPTIFNGKGGVLATWSNSSLGGVSYGVLEQASAAFSGPFGVQLLGPGERMGQVEMVIAAPPFNLTNSTASFSAVWPGPPSFGETCPLPFESAHPYSSNSDYIYEIIKPGAVNITVTFDQQSETESNFDYVRFYRGMSGTSEPQPDLSHKFFEWSGSDVPSPVTVAGDRFWLKFSSDGSQQYWGFKVTVCDNENRDQQRTVADGLRFTASDFGLGASLHALAVVEAPIDRVVQAETNGSRTFEPSEAPRLVHATTQLLPDLVLRHVRNLANESGLFVCLELCNEGAVSTSGPAALYRSCGGACQSASSVSPRGGIVPALVAADAWPALHPAACAHATFKMEPTWVRPFLGSCGSVRFVAKAPLATSGAPSWRCNPTLHGTRLVCGDDASNQPRSGNEVDSSIRQARPGFLPRRLTGGGPFDLRYCDRSGGIVNCPHGYVTCGGMPARRSAPSHQCAGSFGEWGSIPQRDRFQTHVCPEEFPICVNYQNGVEWGTCHQQAVFCERPNLNPVPCDSNGTVPAREIFPAIPCFEPEADDANNFVNVLPHVFSLTDVRFGAADDDLMLAATVTADSGWAIAPDSLTIGGFTDRTTTSSGCSSQNQGRFFDTTLAACAQACSSSSACTSFEYQHTSRDCHTSTSCTTGNNSPNAEWYFFTKDEIGLAWGIVDSMWSGLTSTPINGPPGSTTCASALGDFTLTLAPTSSDNNTAPLTVTKQLVGADRDTAASYQLRPNATNTISMSVPFATLGGLRNAPSVLATVRLSGGFMGQMGVPAVQLKLSPRQLVRIHQLARARMVLGNFPASENNEPALAMDVSLVNNGVSKLRNATLVLHHMNTTTGCHTHECDSAAAAAAAVTMLPVLDGVGGRASQRVTLEWPGVPSGTNTIRARLYAGLPRCNFRRVYPGGALSGAADGNSCDAVPGCRRITSTAACAAAGDALRKVHTGNSDDDDGGVWPNDDDDGEAKDPMACGASSSCTAHAASGRCSTECPCICMCASHGEFLSSRTATVTVVDSAILAMGDTVNMGGSNSSEATGGAFAVSFSVNNTGNASVMQVPIVVSGTVYRVTTAAEATNETGSVPVNKTNNPDGPTCTGRVVVAVRSQEVPTTFTDGSGAGENYDDHLNCEWLLTAPAGAITLRFTRFSTEHTYDKVRLYDGPNVSSVSLGVFSGSETSIVTSTGGIILVHFTSDYGQTRAGFEVECMIAKININMTLLTGTLTIPARGCAIFHGITRNISAVLAADSWALVRAVAQIAPPPFPGLTAGEADGSVVGGGYFVSAGVRTVDAPFASTTDTCNAPATMPPSPSTLSKPHWADSGAYCEAGFIEAEATNGRRRRRSSFFSRGFFFARSSFFSRDFFFSRSRSFFTRQTPARYFVRFPHPPLVPAQVGISTAEPDTRGSGVTVGAVFGGLVATGIVVGLVVLYRREISHKTAAFQQLTEPLLAGLSGIELQQREQEQWQHEANPEAENAGVAVEDPGDRLE